MFAPIRFLSSSSGKSRLPIAPLAVAFLAVLSLSLSPPVHGQASQGKWQTLPTLMPINPVHAALLHNGKVLIVSGSGNVAGNTNFQAGIFDPASGNVSTMPVTWDMFCNGMVILPDGRALVNGGTLQYDPFHGELRSSIYDLATGQFTDVQSMANGRWYPTVTSLGDGSLMTFSGLTETGGTNSTVEIYNVGSGWSVQYGSPFTPPLYPRMHLIPNGKVFYSGSTTASRYFDPVAHTWSAVVANTVSATTRTYGTSVLLPLSPTNNYKPIVMIMGGGNPSIKTTERIDLSAANPKWVSGVNMSPDMSQPRTEMNATILPNGKVIALGGSLNDEDTSTASLNADLYDPVANTFSSAGQNCCARLYHSVSLLLPDGTVWFAGGNPARGTYENRMEIYSPAYLFKADGSLATRPVISSVPASIGYGAAFQVPTPDAATISSIALVRPGAATHAFDMEQRLINLSFTAGSGVLNVTAPPNGNIAPPGYYMLFILNSSGVPSIAKFVLLSSTPADIPPTGTITSPATNVTINAGQSVFFSGSGNDPDGSISAYSWTFPGGSPSSSALASPGNVIYNTPGTYTATFTVTDNANVTDPNPPTRTITVNSPTGLATPALVQHANQDAGSITSSSLAFPANNTAGNWIGVVIRAGKSGTTFSVSDFRGNTYHSAVQFNQTLDAPLGETLAIFYAESVSGGANTVTVSQSSSATLRFAILEYSGVAAANSLDVTAAAQSSGTSLSSGSVNTTGNGDLILGLVATADGVSYTASTGFTIEERVPSSPTKLIAEDMVQPSAGAASVSATLSGSNNGGALLAAFRPAVSSGSTNPTIASLNPTSGPVGTPVTIMGANFGATQSTSTVTFNGTSAGAIAPANWSSTSITANVPAGATSGNVVVTVGGVASNPTSFSVTSSAPTITNLNPTSGAVGSPVTITGTNFGATQSTSIVTFNNTSAGAIAPANWSATNITANVPTGATSGNVVVTVGGVASNAVPFSVTTGSPTPIALVQHASADAGTTTSSLLGFTANNTAGNWIGVVIRAGHSGETFTVSDSRGNTYHPAAQLNQTLDAPLGESLAIFYAEGIAGGANAITVTQSASATLRFAILEYSGIATANSLDVTAAAQGSGTSLSSGSVSTTASGDLILGLVASADGMTFTAGTGFAIEERVPAAPGTKLIAEDAIQAAAGPISVSATLSSSNNGGAVLAAFKQR